MGNGEAKELKSMTHGRELRWGDDGRRTGTEWKGINGRKNGKTVIAKSVKYI